MLREKTEGNLTNDEENLFENLLAELRMQFVSLKRFAGKGDQRGAKSTKTQKGGPTALCVFVLLCYSPWIAALHTRRAPNFCDGNLSRNR
jgi:hypothetical protein